MMFAPTTSATIGSRGCQPVSHTSAMPTMTPTVVQTSVSKWCPSASRAVERYFLPARMSATPTAPLRMVATTENARPMPSCSTGTGWISLSTAV